MKRIPLIFSLVIWTGAACADGLFTEKMPWGAEVELEMVWIEPGSFAMGTTEKQEQLLRDKGLWISFVENERPSHQVAISRGFYLGKYEITQKQWKTVMGTTPWIGWKDVRVDDAHPAVYISWNDVQQFVQLLNQAAGDSLYRLPTEAEWEYACRAGTSTLWSFGDDERQKEAYAWYEANAWGTDARFAHRVGTKKPNAWGLYDMHGNVWEWCQDWYAPYVSGDQTDPMGPPHGKARIGRGGAFNDYIETARSAFRNRSEPDIPYGIIGARILRRK